MSRRCEVVPSHIKIPNVMDMSVKNGFFRSMVWQRIKKADLASRIKTNWDKQLGFPATNPVSGVAINGNKRRSFWKHEAGSR